MRKIFLLMAMARWLHWSFRPVHQLCPGCG